MSNIKSPVKVTADSAEELRKDLSFQYHLTADSFVIVDQAAYDAVTVQLDKAVNEHTIQKSFYGDDIQSLQNLNAKKYKNQTKIEDTEKKYNRQSNFIVGLGLCATVATAVAVKYVLDGNGLASSHGELMLGVAATLTPLMTAIGIGSYRANTVSSRKIQPFVSAIHELDKEIEPIKKIQDEYRDNLHIIDVLNGALSNYERQNPGQDYPKRKVPSFKPEMV